MEFEPSNGENCGFEPHLTLAFLICSHLHWKRFTLHFFVELLSQLNMVLMHIYKVKLLYESEKCNGKLKDSMKSLCNKLNC